MNRACDALVAGAGIMGMSTALELARDGASVTVLDPHPPGHKASWAAAGILVTRGAQRPHSEFRRFYLTSIAAYPSWLAELEQASGLAIPYHREGDTLVYDRRKSSGEKAYQEKIAQLRREEALPWQESQELPPYLGRFAMSARDGLAVLRFPGEAYVQNRILLQALEAACRRYGVHFATGELHGLSGGTGPWRIEVATPKVEVANSEPAVYVARHLLISAGSWSETWLQALGWRSQLLPVKGQVALIPRPWRETGMLHLQEDLYLIPRGENMIVGATTEPGEWSESFTEDGGRLLAARLHDLLPGLEFRPLETWTGLRPRTRDRLPLMGALPDHENVWICTGHYKCGISMAPLAGRSMAALMQGRRPPFDLKAFDPARKGALQKYRS